MHTHPRSSRLARALSAPVAAAGLLGTVALLSAAHRDAEVRTDAFPLHAVFLPSLGAAANVTVLGGAGVTCTTSSVTGAVSSKLTVTKAAGCTIAGDIHQGDASAVGSFRDFLTAYAGFNALPCPAANDLTGKALGGRTLAPGVYCFDSTAELTTGNLTLAGPSTGTWVFRIATSITTGNAQVVMSGGAQACNVYWVLGTGATIGTDTRFKGNVLAGSSVTFTGVNSGLVGRAMGQAAVTMSGTDISGCGATRVKPRR